MDGDRRRMAWRRKLVAVFVTTLVAYVAAYFALVDFEYVRVGISPDIRTNYRIGDNFLEPLFAPMHELDRNLLRPYYWEQYGRMQRIYTSD